MIVCIAEGIRKELKSEDLAGRIDDDKFVILFNDMEKEQLEIKLLKLQKNMKSRIKRKISLFIVKPRKMRSVTG